MAERAGWSFRILVPSILPTNCGKSHSYTAACVGVTSEPEFCSVAYFRFSYANDAVRCAFVTAETRAAPKKLLTIPKPELQAAVLSAMLSNVKVKDHNYKIPTCGLTVANLRVICLYCCTELVRFWTQLNQASGIIALVLI